MGKEVQGEGGAGGKGRFGWEGLKEETAGFPGFLDLQMAPGGVHAEKEGAGLGGGDP